MAKTHRGTGIRALPNHGRAKCARCGKEDIKTLYEQEIDGKKVNICKYCKAALKNVAEKNARAAKSVTPAAAAEPAGEEAKA